MKKINNIILTDGGLETDLIFNHNIELEHFAAFPLVEDHIHKNTLKNYYKDYLEVAKDSKTGFILESPTWRANLDWGLKLGYTKERLIAVNKLAIAQLADLRETYSKDIQNIFVSGQIGPRGDGYQVNTSMSYLEASDYHNLQVQAFKEANVDLVTAITMTYSEEALGIVKSTEYHNIPVVISFTVELDGKLPSGESLKEAIKKIDNETGEYPLYYMINCAHPTHFIAELETDEAWKNRIQGIRANASCKSHAELDEALELDKGDKGELGVLHKKLQLLLPELKVYGGCCGTDVSHVTTICNAIRMDSESLFTESEVLVPINDTLIVQSEMDPKSNKEGLLILTKNLLTSN
ncbi:homocysteine S-methyltransferase [Flagellimonas hymeniacidonis]|uniref:Homocysteine S-methyltransferase n=1 Tax=Flagellimonas hymeniacidonis TaxID=2603628 RepID=A0A5C8V2Q4_9FLAO|nr:homocysteine S-methyltransferase family protein [Flagellimonas hymeniacidonis]TXN35215.1 homocysteine S-methyltransferase [Flagellimonas hymeniacidonis]